LVAGIILSASTQSFGSLIRDRICFDFHSLGREPSIVRPIRLWGNKKFRFALIGVVVGVVVVLICLLLPHRSDLTLRLKIVRTGVENGEAGVLFRIEGGEQYELYCERFRYLLGKNGEIREVTFSLQSPVREVWVTLLLNTIRTCVIKVGRFKRMFFFSPRRKRTWANSLE
jgi:hypothetical protein